VRDAAADWLSTVPERASSEDARTEKSRTYATFRDAYFRLGELRWKETGDLCGKPQTAGESVEEYMVRDRRCVKRLDMKPEAVCEAVLNGLRPNLRVAILALKPNGLDELVRALVDSGAVRSIVSGDMYRRILKHGSKTRYVNDKLPNLFSADSSPMKAQALIDVDVKLGGVTFPFVFIVVERLGFDCILGMDLLNETKAVIDVHQCAAII